jgi:predicted metal-dependent phosphoesterase TrpH
MSLDQALSRARQLGLDGVCFTDHHSRAAARFINEGVQDNGLVVLVGQEYATDQGDFLLFGPLPELAPSMPAPQLLQMASNAGGVAIAAHPCRQGRSLDPALAASGLLRFIEGVNGRNLVEENHLASGWGRENSLGLVGGSDAHTPEEVGAALTEFKHPVHSQQDLVRALASGAFQAHWTADSYMQIFSATRYVAAGQAG